jgi:hypothetical protein
MHSERVVLQQFVRMLSTTYPVSSFLLPSFAASATFQQVMQGERWTARHWQQVNSGFPALHALMSGLGLDILPARLRNTLMQHLQARALKLQDTAAVSLRL